MYSSIVQRFARVYEKSRAQFRTTSTPSVPDEDDLDLADVPDPSSSSNTSTTDTPSTDDLADLWDEAVCQYRDIIGIDLHDENSEPALHQRLKGCFDVHKLNRALDSMAQDFGVYRGSSSTDIGGKIRRALKPVIRTVLVVLDVGGEAAATVPGGKAIFVAIGVLFKTTQEVSKRFDAVASLLEKFSFYLVRLKVNTRTALEGALRALTVETLAHMLCSFAVVTKMMRRNRMGQFFAVLRGQGDGLTDLTQRAENLMEEESRLTLTESLYAIKSISAKFDNVLGKIGAQVQALAEVTKELDNKIGSSGLLDMPTRLQEFVEKDRTKLEIETIQHRAASIPVIVHITRESYRTTQRVDDTTRRIDHATQRLESQLTMLEEYMQRKSFMTTRVFLPCYDRVSISRVADNLLNCFWGLSTDERSMLKQDMATLLAIATIGISGGGGQNTAEVVISGWLRAVDLLAAFLPLAATYVAFFAFGKHLASILGARRAIPRNPRYLAKETITLIDILHVRIMLPLDMCRSWDDFHSILVDRFSGTEGAEYVTSRAYQIMNSASVIEPRTWTKIVQGGMTVEMSIVVAQLSQSLQCPWCKTEASCAADTHNTRVECTACHRPYWASRQPVAETKSEGPILDSVQLDDSVPKQAVLPQNGPEESQPARTERTIDLTSFRLVTIMQSTPVSSQLLLSASLPLSSSSPEISPPADLPSTLPDYPTPLSTTGPKPITNARAFASRRSPFHNAPLDTSPPVSSLRTFTRSPESEPDSPPIRTPPIRTLSPILDEHGLPIPITMSSPQLPMVSPVMSPLPLRPGTQPPALIPTPHRVRLVLHPVLTVNLEAILADARRVDQATLAEDATRPGRINLHIRGPGLLWECHATPDYNGRSVTVHDVLSSLNAFLECSVTDNDYYSVHGDTQDAVWRAFRQRIGHDEAPRSRGIVRRDFLQGWRLIAIAPSDREDTVTLVLT